MSEQSKYLDVVLKLNRLTQDGKLNWKHRPPQPADAAVGKPKLKGEYVAEHRNKLFALYRTLSKIPTPLPEARERTVLEIRDAPIGEAQFEFPAMPAIEDLYETVTAGEPEEIERFLDAFLEEE